MKFKVGQTVYFYQVTDKNMGAIVECTIKKATKDLSSGKITYSVDVPVHPLRSWYSSSEHLMELTEENIYSSKKQIEKEYKEELVYNNLKERINRLESLLYDVKTELQKDEHKNFEGMTLSIDGTTSWNKVYMNAEDVDIGGISLKEEIDKINKEIASIKKKIKSKTKKPVVKKTENEVSCDTKEGK